MSLGSETAAMAGEFVDCNDKGTLTGPRAVYRGEESWLRERYRVTPERERSRGYKFLTEAVRFARAAFVRQGLADLTPVVIVRGSGSSYHRVGCVDVTGWQPEPDYR